MPIFVRDAGQWREISSSTGGEVFLRDGTSYTNKTINNIYVKDSGTWQEVYSLFETTSFATISSSGQTTIAVPSNANAIHVQQAVGGGGGGTMGAGYDRAGGESSGGSGGSGAYVSDRVYTVTAGEQLTADVGGGGVPGNLSPGYNTSAASGGNTSLTGASAGTLFNLGSGGGSSNSTAGGGLLTATPGTAGALTTAGTSLSSGTTVDGLNITTFNSGVVGTFNSSGVGVVGATNGNCNGDQCVIYGANGAASYDGNVAGGLGDSGSGTGYNNATAGTLGSGGGAGAHRDITGTGGNYTGTNGAAGGVGQIVYRFLRIS